MSINFSEVIWTVICFFALLFVLKTFLFGPLIRHMDQRQSRIDAGMDEARLAEDAREEARQAAEASWQECGDEARELLAQGKTRDTRERTEILEEARRQSAQTLRDARIQCDRQESEARESVSQSAGEMARELADRLLSAEKEG